MKKVKENLLIKLAKENARLKKENDKLNTEVVLLFSALPAGWHNFNIETFCRAIAELRKNNWDYFTENEELRKLNDMLAMQLVELENEVKE